MAKIKLNLRNFKERYLRLESLGIIETIDLN